MRETERERGKERRQKRQREVKKQLLQSLSHHLRLIFPYPHKFLQGIRTVWPTQVAMALVIVDVVCSAS